MKALLISIRPQWVELILNFIKKDEIRKGTAIGKAINKLIEEQGVAPTLIYCTKKDSLGRIKDIPHDRYFVDCVDTPQDFEKMDSGYDGKGKVVARFNATAEEICYLDTLDVFATLKLGKSLMKRSCLTVDEMKTYLNGRNGTAIHINDLEIFDKPKEISEFKPHYGYPTNHRLTRAPQSWQFIEI